jgi:hypothetical protein
MSTQPNQETDQETEPQVPAQSEALSDEKLDTVAGGAVVLGTGGVEVSLTPIRGRLPPGTA